MHVAGLTPNNFQGPRLGAESTSKTASFLRASVSFRSGPFLCLSPALSPSPGLPSRQGCPLLAHILETP